MLDTPAPQAGEDAFFVLRYCREHFQQRLSELVHQCGITAGTTIDTFRSEVGEAHDELAAQAKQGSGFSETKGLTASRISLVGHDELELEIRIGDLVTHLKNDENIDHWRVQLRYMTLLNRSDMRPEQNPLGFETITRGLWALCHHNGYTSEQNLVLLDRLEEMLALRLPDIYTELNGLLEHHRIAPASVSIVQRPNEQRARENTAGSRAADTPGALTALHQALQRQSAPSLLGSGTDFAPIPFASSLATGARGTNAALDASALVMLGQLMERLHAIESRQFDRHLSHPEIHSLQSLKSKDLDLPLGGAAGVALDTLSMIFDAIFATPDLPDSVKTAIGRLQIPLLKRAILDPDFFGNLQHPARMAINLLARAAIGLPRDTRHDHPVCAQLSLLAETIRPLLESEQGDISAPLGAINTLIRERDQSIATEAQIYLRLANEHETNTAASQKSQDWLVEISQPAIPKAIRQFFALCWLRVMEKAYRTDGKAGDRWMACATTAKDLLSSVLPKQTADERKELLLLIPDLLKRINAGLDIAGISAEERKPFLDACFDLQTAALRNRPAAQDTETTIPPPANERFTGYSSAASDKPSSLLLEAQGKRVMYFSAAAEAIWRGAPAWKTGDWLMFQAPGDSRRRCGRLCGLTDTVETLLIFNSEWQDAIALPPSVVAQQLRDKQAVIASEHQLFDEAASKALSKVRQN